MAASLLRVKLLYLLCETTVGCQLERDLIGPQPAAKEYNSESDCKSRLKINVFSNRLLFPVLAWAFISLAALPSFFSVMLERLWQRIGDSVIE